MPPTEAEISDMSREVFDRSKIFDYADSASSESYSEHMYHPACWSQAECLPEALWFAFRKLWNFYHSHQATYSPLLSLEPFDNRWLDLNQIKLNPYFSHLFGKRLRQKYGRVEIEMLASPSHLTKSPFATLDSLNYLIRPMFATQPPCKGLGIYIIPSVIRDEKNGFFPTPLAYIRNDDGTRIGKLLDALERNSPAVVTSWLADAEFHRDRFASHDWLYFPRFGHSIISRELYWANFYDICPRVMIILDGHQPRPNKMYCARSSYALVNNYNRQEKEWLEVLAQWSEKEGLTEL
jgi:hypothetical protein